MIRRTKENLPPRPIALWIVCLSALAVGARNFELGGIGVDGPMYALMARGIARTGDWFVLNGTVPAFMPFADHPHLGIWLLGLVFHVLPAADWSARIVGIGFYVGFLGLFFHFLRKAMGIRRAVIGTLVLWSFYRFSNYFSHVCLDPGALFFGFGAIVFLYQGLTEKRRALCIMSGVFISASAMVKGLMVLGFLPALAYVLWLSWSQNREKGNAWFWRTGAFAFSAVAVLGVYLLLVEWNAPGLTRTYWANQWQNRFSQTWNWSLLFGWRFWGSLARDTHYLLFVALGLAIYKRPKALGWVPWILLGSFALIYAPADRVGIHYWVALLPWVSWAFVDAIPEVGKKWLPLDVMKASGALALVLLFLIQFFPFRVHGKEDAELPVIQSLVKSGRIQQMVLDMRPDALDFTFLDKYTWYADVPIQTVVGAQAIAKPKPRTGYLLFFGLPTLEKEVLAAGWCLEQRWADRALFVDCPRYASYGR